MLAWLTIVSTVSAASVDTGGHLKAIGLSGGPVPLSFVDDEPWYQATLAARLKLKVEQGEHIQFVFHPDLVGTWSSGSGEWGTGIGAEQPEAIDLSWSKSDGDLFTALRVDRLHVVAQTDGFRATVGRQAITFGQGKLFTPVDLVAPFNPTSIDTEFKPGVDAVRLEGFVGQVTTFTAAATHMGDWGMADLGLVGHGQTTFGTTDVALLGGSVRGDGVIGVSFFTPVQAIGLYGDVSVTWSEDLEWRGVVGADVRPTETTTLSAEVYTQTFGGDDPKDTLVVVQDERYQTGELWLSGHHYAGLTLVQELVPLWTISVVSIMNLTDPSAMLGTTLHWSAAENADVSAGGFIGLGERPDDVEMVDLLDASGRPLQGDEMRRSMGVNSEFGLMPATAFLQTSVYF